MGRLDLQSILILPAAPTQLNWFLIAFAIAFLHLAASVEPLLLSGFTASMQLQGKGRGCSCPIFEVHNGGQKMY